MVTTRVTCTAKRCRSRIFSPAKCPSRRVPRGSCPQCVSTRRKQDRNAEPSKFQSTRAAGPTLLVHERQWVSSNSGDAHCVYDLRPTLTGRVGAWFHGERRKKRQVMPVDPPFPEPAKQPLLCAITSNRPRMALERNPLAHEFVCAARAPRGSRASLSGRPASPHQP